MKKKKLLVGLGAIIAFTTVSLIVLGMLFSESEEEKLNGFSGHFDVTSDGTIAYVSYAEGKPEIHIYDSETSQQTKVVELENDQIILDPTFSSAGSMLTYIATNKDLEENLTSTVQQISLETNEAKELFSAPSAVTEIEFSPSEESLMYLKAGVFQNYSPIASKRPHDFDVFEYRFTDNNHIQHTELKKYSMSSLHIADDGKSVFVQMDDDSGVKTAEDSFEVNQRIFQIGLDQQTEPLVVSDQQREVDIFDFALVPNNNEMVFQSISNFKDGGTFQYELFSYNMETREEKQLTNLKEYTANPVVNPEDNKIYFVVDYQFAQHESDYRLYEMKIDGTGVKEISFVN